MIKNSKVSHRVKESITNLVGKGQLPADEAQLNLDVMYESILDEICTIIPMDSPRQIISCFKLIYDSEHKALTENVNGDKQDVFQRALMSGVSIPLDESGYPTEDVHCIVSGNSFAVNYKPIIPGTVKIFVNGVIKYTDDSKGNILDNSEANIGTIDYVTGAFNLNTALATDEIEYKFDIYNVETSRNFVKFVKKFVEVFADMYQLDVDSAMCLDEFKSLDLSKQIQNIIPQVLSQQIDSFILNKYFTQAETSSLGTWNAEVVWDGVNRIPVSALYEDFGTFLSTKASEFTNKHGVVPNIILCSPKGYGILSSSKKFIPIENIDKDSKSFGSIPRLVGYFNNSKVILTNVQNSVDVVLTYKGNSDAQTAGVCAPFIPVSIRAEKGNMKSNFMLTTNVYSIMGFAMINPELVESITITNA